MLRLFLLFMVQFLAVSVLHNAQACVNISLGVHDFFFVFEHAICQISFCLRRKDALSHFQCSYNEITKTCRTRDDELKKERGRVLNLFLMNNLARRFDFFFCYCGTILMHFLCGTLRMRSRTRSLDFHDFLDFEHAIWPTFQLFYDYVNAQTACPASYVHTMK